MYRVMLLLTALASAFAESGGPAGDPSTTGTSGGSGAAGSGGSAAGQSGGIPPMTVLMFGGLFLFVWFFLIRPQRKEEKKRQDLVASIKPGHKVITIGGIHGEVTAVGETTVDVRVSDTGPGVVMTFNKGAVATNLTTNPPAVAAAK
jgi:preprotein translocase subunit YajC